jgi:hypothetical protein
MTAQNEEKIREKFERIYLEGNKQTGRRNSTTGDYVVGPIQDAYAGWKVAIAQERIESQKREDELQAFIKDLRFNYELGDELDAKMDKLLGANK